MNLKSILKTFVVSAALLGMHLAHAGQSATKECLDSECTRWELHVRITTDRDDAGLPTAYGVLAILKEPKSSDGHVAYWTEEKQWAPLVDGEIIKPIFKSLVASRTERDFIIFTGTTDEFCELTHGNDVNLFAWHVGMEHDQRKKEEAFLNRFGIEGWQAENFRNSLFFYEANRKNKVGWVYKYTCRRSS